MIKLDYAIPESHFPTKLATRTLLIGAAVVATIVLAAWLSVFMINPVPRAVMP